MKLGLTKQKPFLYTIGLLLFMSEVVSIICLHEGYSGFIFFLYQVLGVLLPGFGLLLLFGWHENVSWKTCAISFFVGYCVTLFEYFVLMLLGLRQYIVYAVVFLVIVSGSYVAYRYKKGDVYIEQDTKEMRRDSLLIVFFATLIFIVTLLASCCYNMVQPITNTASPVNDMLYWVQDVIELSMEFPPINIHNLEPTYTYHYFAAAQLAFSCIVTSIRPLYMAFYFSAVQSVMLKIFGTYLVVSVCNSKYVLKVIGMILLFFASGWEAKVIITYLAHSYHASFGMEYAFSFFLLFLYFLIEKNKEERNNLRTSISIWIIIFVMSGLKIAYGALALFALGVACFIWLLQKKISKSFVTGIPSLVLFLMEYFTLINTSRYSNAESGSGSLISPIYEGYMNGLFFHIESITSLIHLPAEPFFIIAYLFLSNPVCFFIVVYNVYRLTKYRKWDAVDVAFLLTYIAGFAITIFMSMYGVSNMYFAMVSYPVVITWMLRLELPCSHVSKVVLVAMAMLSVVGFCMGYNENATLYDYISGGYSLAVNGDVKTEYIDDRTYVNEEEYQAYEWIRLHTEPGDTISMNRESSIVTVYTERYCINPMHGKSIFNCETDNDRRKMIDSYQERGVKYILFDSKYHGDNEYIVEHCNMVYSTGNITIYEIT